MKIKQQQYNYDKNTHANVLKTNNEKMTNS